MCVIFSLLLGVIMMGLLFKHVEMEATLKSIGKIMAITFGIALLVVFSLVVTCR